MVRNAIAVYAISRTPVVLRVCNCTNELEPVVFAEEQQRWRENSFTKEEVGISTPDPRGSIPATPPRSAEATGRVPSLRVSVDTAAYERTNAKRSHANDGNTSPDPRSKRFKSYDDSVCRTSEFQSSGERDAGIQSLVENVAASGVLGDDLIWSEARTVFRDAIKQVNMTFMNALLASEGISTYI
jgi:hypothetical protein